MTITPKEFAGFKIAAFGVMEELQTYGNFTEFDDDREPDGKNAGAKLIIAQAIACEVERLRAEVERLSKEKS